MSAKRFFRFFLVFAALPLLRAQPMSVCEVLANLSALNGKEIKVRGVWRIGDAVRSLWSVPPCEKRAIRDHWEFIDAIQVGPQHPRSAVADYQEYRRVSANHPGKNIFVTMFGVLHAPEHFEVWTDPWGVERPRAFSSMFAAQLAYLYVTDFKAVQPPDETQEESDWRAHPQPRRVR